MNTNLVYLHIQKSAGSAQRLLYYQTIGRDNVYWHGVPNTSQKKMYEFFIVGGHAPFPFYENKDFIYTAVVRSPVQRVLSFYNYCKEVIPDLWVPFGLDTLSLKNTVKSCQEFRSAINNWQCKYVSGSGRYDDAIDSMFKSEFLIGCINDVDAFNSHIARNLELSYKELPLDNVGKQDYVDEIDLDTECLAEIESLVSEDEKLYQFIVQDCKGLYSSVSDARWKLARIALRKLQSGSESPHVPDNSIREQAVRSAGFVLIAANLGEQTTIHCGEILNLELEFSVARAMETLEVGIHILDSTNRQAFSTNSTMLGRILTSVSPGTHRAHYSLVADLPEGQYTAGFTFTEYHAGEYRELSRFDNL